MNQSYAYPLDSDWSTDEIVIVVNFLNGIEAAYETGIMTDELMKRYREFKTIVTSIRGEKRLDREFQQLSGLSIYRVMKIVKESDLNKPYRLKMKG